MRLSSSPLPLLCRSCFGRSCCCPQSKSVAGLLAIALVGLGTAPAWSQQPDLAPAVEIEALEIEVLEREAPNQQPVDAEDLAPELPLGEEPNPAAPSAGAEAEETPEENPGDSPEEDIPDAGATEEAPAEPPLSLERPLEDPLLPGKLKPDQRLTPPEQERLRLGLDRIDREAEALYLQGDAGGAYRQFFRGLALRQHLTVEEEIPALGNVGERAWGDGSAEAVQTITERLMAIALTLEDATELQSVVQRPQLAQAYGRVRALDEAIAQYEILLAQAADFAQAVDLGAIAAPESLAESSPESSAPPTEPAASQPPLAVPRAARLSDLTRQWIETLARLNLARLNYSEAARYTELALAQAQLAPPKASLTIIPAPDSLSPSSPAKPRGSASASNANGLSPATSRQSTSPAPGLGSPQPLASPRQLLAQLAYVYEQDRRYAEAATIHQQRLEDYTQPLDLPLRPALYLAIARNQDLAGQLVEAIASYQETYRQAQLQQQFAISHDALAHLAQLYRNQGQLNDALAVYNILRQVDELSYDLYGLMENQANQAEIHLLQDQRPQALRAYRQALHLARLLGYREAEFAAKLAQLQQPAERPEVPGAETTEADPLEAEAVESEVNAPDAARE